MTNRNTSQLVTCIGQNSGCKYFFVEKITVQHSVLLKLFVCLDIKLSFSYRVLNVGVIQNFKFQNSELRRKNHFLQVQNSKSKGITTLPIHILTKIDKRHNFEWWNISHAAPVPFVHLITVPSTADKWYFQLYFWKKNPIIQTVVRTLKPV